MGEAGSYACRRTPMGDRPIPKLRRKVAREGVFVRELGQLRARMDVDWVQPCSVRVSRVGQRLCTVVELVCVVGLVVWWAAVPVVSGSVVAVVAVVWCLGLAGFRVSLRVGRSSSCGWMVVVVVAAVGVGECGIGPVVGMLVWWWAVERRWAR